MNEGKISYAENNVNLRTETDCSKIYNLFYIRNIHRSYYALQTLQQIWFSYHTHILTYFYIYIIIYMTYYYDALDICMNFRKL